MVGSHFYVGCFGGYAAGDVELARGNVEVGRCDVDGEVDGDALGGGGAGVVGVSYAAEGAGGEEVGGLDEVVGVPL